MKYTTKVYILLFSMGVMLLTSCIKEKYNSPSQIIPDANLTANVTIAQLNSFFAGTLTPVLFKDTLILGSDTILHPVIQGIVNSTDESGNIYKTLYIQDNTGGIQLALDRTSLYTNFKVGQRVFVKLSGIYVGTYGLVVQLGYIYGGTMGRMPDAMIDLHVFKDSLPGPAPIPLERTVSTVSGNDVNMLVVLRKVHFAEVGSIYAEPEITTERTILDSVGTSFIKLRNSGYANFRASLLPKGQGDLVGVYSLYNGNKQFYIRDLNDLENWDSIITFPVNIINESFATSLGTFTQYSVIGNQVWAQYTTPASSGSVKCAKMSGYAGGINNQNEDWLISNSVNINNFSSKILSFRTAMQYGSPTDGSFKVVYSTDYVSGDPTSATWTEIAIPLSGLPTGIDWNFVLSGNIDLSTLSGTNFHIAIKYTSTTSSCATWEITDIKLTVQ